MKHPNTVIGLHILKEVHFLLTYFLVCQKRKLIKKIKALSFYKSQLRKGHRDKNSIIKQSQIRGSEIGGRVLLKHITYIDYFSSGHNT